MADPRGRPYEASISKFHQGQGLDYVRQIFKTRTFARWSRKAQVSDKALVKAITEMAARLIDADLGGSVLGAALAFIPKYRIVNMTI